MYSPQDHQIRPSRIDGLQIFAVRDIPVRTPLLEYVGRCLSKSQITDGHDRTYCFVIDEDHVLDGAAGMWNPAAFFNHSCRRDVTPGEELTFNYGYTLRNVRQNRCRCGAQGCIGYIVGKQHLPS